MTDDEKAKLKVIYKALADGFDREAFVLGTLGDIAERDHAGYSISDAETLRIAREQLISIRDAVCCVLERVLS